MKTIFNFIVAYMNKAKKIGSDAGYALGKKLKGEKKK